MLIIRLHIQSKVVAQLTIIAVISVKLLDSFGCYGDVYLPLDMELVVGGLTAGVESGPFLSVLNDTICWATTVATTAVLSMFKPMTDATV